MKAIRVNIYRPFSKNPEAAAEIVSAAHQILGRIPGLTILAGQTRPEGKDSEDLKDGVAIISVWDDESTREQGLKHPAYRSWVEKLTRGWHAPGLSKDEFVFMIITEGKGITAVRDDAVPEGEVLTEGTTKRFSFETM